MVQAVRKALVGSKMSEVKRLDLNLVPKKTVAQAEKGVNSKYKKASFLAKPILPFQSNSVSTYPRNEIS